jgi:predicted PurR-regulated permease PerM
MHWLRNTAYLLIVIIGGGFLLLQGRGLLFPIFFAIFFSFLLMPLEHRLHKVIPNKAFSITSCILLVLGFITAIGFGFSYQIIQIVQEMTSIQAQVEAGIEKIFHFIDQNIPYMQMPDDQASMNAMISKLIQAPVEFVGAGISNGAGFLFNAATTLIYTIFLLIYKEAFRDFIMIQFPKDKRDEIEKVLSQSAHLIQRYLVGMVTVIIILAVLNCVGLILIGVEHAILWGVLAAFLVIIPYIGTTIGGLLPFLYTLTNAEYTWQPFLVIIMYVFIQQVEANYITPKIVGSHVRINPFFALMGTIVMGTLMGIGGIVLALPVLAIIKLVAEGIDVLKPVALLMDKDLMKNRHLFYAKYDGEDYRFSSVIKEEPEKR